MATPKIVADFETQLATALSVGGTSFTLSSATDDDGVALPAGKYYFTIDNGTSQKEYVVGTLSGTSVTSVSNVTRQGSESSGVDRAHRVGASVIMTDFLTYKNYIDETTVAGASDADTSTKGVVETATLAEVRAGTATGGTGAALAVTPDVLDDLPTQDEKAAMAGGGDFGSPSTSNKYLTEDYLGTGTSDQVTFTSSGTWTKDSGLVRVRVQTWGGGGGGNNTVNDGGGGGGGYSEKWFEAADLGATETVTIGSGGSTGGGNGGDTTFGSLLTAYGGEGGGSTVGGNAGGPTQAGSAGSGGLNAAGSVGNADGSDGIFGGGGAHGNGFDGGNAYWGGAGGGTDAGVGGTSIHGGNGGTTGGAAPTQPGGGGSRGVAGADGQVIVTEYYS